MKIETRTKEVKQEYKVYIANDGTEFNDEQECQKYDDSAVCAYRILLTEVYKPIKGSFKWQDTKDHPEIVNIFKNVIDDLFEDSRRDCEYFTFTPRTEEDVKNFIAMLKVQNASTRGSGYTGFENPFCQLEDLTAGKKYVVIYYNESEFYNIIEPVQYANAVTGILKEVFPKEPAI